MDRTRTVLCWVYYALAGIALVATQKQNNAFMAGQEMSFFEGFAQFWLALLANHATISISVDLLVFAVTATVWMLYEARRLQIRFVWIYIVLGIFVAISVTFPIFLAVRERRLWTLQVSHQQGKPNLAELVALTILACITLAGVIYAAMI